MESAVEESRTPLLPSKPFDREDFEPDAPSITPNFSLGPLELNFDDSDNDSDKASGESLWALLILTLV